MHITYIVKYFQKYVLGGHNRCIIQFVIKSNEKAINRQIVTRFELMNGLFNESTYD